MGKKIDEKYILNGIVITISACICILFAHILKKWSVISGALSALWSAFAPFVVGIILAFLLNPCMVAIRRAMYTSKKKKNPDLDENAAYKKTKTPALIFTMIIFVVVFGGFLWIVIPRIYESIKDLVDNMPTYIENMRNWAESIFAKNKMLEGRFESVINFVEDTFNRIVRDRVLPNMDVIAVNVTNGVVVGIKGVFNALVGLIVMIYLLASKDELLAQGKKIIYCIFNKKRGNKIIEGCSYANMVFGGFIIGKIIDSIIIGILCFIFTAAVDMKYAVLISVIVGVTNVIPFFGPFIGAIPGALLALMDAPIYFFIFVVWIIILQQFDGNILGPLILGDSTGLSGVWVLVAILVGGDLFGVPGMIMGVPVFACIYAFIAVLLRDNLRKKKLPSDTEYYIGLKGFDVETGEPEYYDKQGKKRTLKSQKKSKKIKISKIKVAENNDNK